jgi:hypothetical protein
MIYMRIVDALPIIQVELLSTKEIVLSYEFKDIQPQEYQLVNIKIKRFSVETMWMSIALDENQQTSVLSVKLLVDQNELIMNSVGKFLLPKEAVPGKLLYISELRKQWLFYALKKADSSMVSVFVTNELADGSVAVENKEVFSTPTLWGIDERGQFLYLLTSGTDPKTYDVLKMDQSYNIIGKSLIGEGRLMGPADMLITDRGLIITDTGFGTPDLPFTLLSNIAWSSLEFVSG